MKKFAAIWIALLIAILLSTQAWAAEGDPVLIDSSGGISTDQSDGSHKVYVANTTNKSSPIDGECWYNKTLDCWVCYDGTDYKYFWGTSDGENPDAIEFIIDGGGSAITTGEKGHLEIPYSCTIKRVTMMADQSGSIVVDLWVDTYANFPATDSDSITASAPPTISTAQKSQDSTLSGWTTSLSAGSIIAYNVDSCSTITRCTVSLVVEK